MKISFKSLIRTGAALLVATVLFTACKKSDDPTYPAEGLWSGKYGNGTTTPDRGYSMVVENGGKLTVANGDVITGSTIANGTWTITGNVFKGTYTYIISGSTFTLQGNWSSNGKITNGTWGSGTSATGGGTWYMDRRN